MKKLILLASFVFASISSLHAAGECCSAHAASASTDTVKPVQMEKAQFPAEGVTAEYVQKAADAGCPATAMIQAQMKAAASKDSCCATEVQQASAKPAGADACCSAELAVAEAQSERGEDCCAEKSDCGEECSVVADASAEDSDAAQG